MRKLIAFTLFAAVTAGLTLSPTGTFAQDKKDKKDPEKLKVEIEVPYVPTDEKVVLVSLLHWKTD